jgi:hypothetical protein
LSTIQTVTETLIRLAKQAIHPDTVLVFPDDLFEVQRTPSVILQGPKLTEDRFRRSQSRLFEKNVAELSFEECRFPRLEFHESVSRFIQLHPVIVIDDQGSLNLTELVPLGGLARVNLSNLRQSSGRIRIESCPVYDGDLRDGRLIRDRTFQFHVAHPCAPPLRGDLRSCQPAVLPVGHGDVTEQRTIQP